NAYNRPDQLSAARRGEVLRVAAELGYSGPDPLASGLRRGRSGAVGVLYDASLAYAFADPAASLFLGGVAGALEGAGLNLLLLPAPGSRPQGRGALSAAGVDGSISYSCRDGSPLLEELLGRGLPTVLVDQSPRPGASLVGVDDFGGARAAARHLLGLGHRRLGVLGLGGGPDGAGSGYRAARERLRGYRAALTEAGLDAAGLELLEAGANTRQQGERLARELLRRHDDLSGLLCMSDVLAQGALRAVGEGGRFVAVVGYDDLPAAELLGLSSVAQPTEHKGERAGRALLELRNGGAPQEVTLPTRLIVRASSSSGPGLRLTDPFG
ncbi:MAG: substrate-binding domain-containing protein, partial [Deinococcus sp.]